MMQLLLESEGVTVAAAENGADGLALIERTEPDLALVDLGLPVMSGFELARRLRDQSPAVRTRLVALSGYGRIPTSRRRSTPGSTSTSPNRRTRSGCSSC